MIHPQSVIHSMVQYRDTSVVAQLGTPDMRVPIAYGLAWPERVASGAQALDFGALADMSFESLDSRGHRERFPGLQLAWDSLAAAPGTTAVLNAANEVAVAAFLDRRIRFDQIHSVNLATLEAVAPSKPQPCRTCWPWMPRPARRAATAIRAASLTESIVHADRRCLHRRPGPADRRARVRPLPGGGGLRRQGAALLHRLRQDAVPLETRRPRPGRTPSS